MVISCFFFSFSLRTMKLFHPHYDKRAFYIKETKPKEKKQNYAKYQQDRRTQKRDVKKGTKILEGK